MLPMQLSGGDQETFKVSKYVQDIKPFFELKAMRH